MKIHLVATISAALAALLLGVAVSSAPGRAQDAAAAPEPVPACNEQTPQDFLIRGNFVTKARMSPDEIRSRRAVHARAIRYRTENYGYFEGFGEAAWNDHTPTENAIGLRVFGLRVRLNARIAPAVRCAEEAVAQNCAAHPYTPVRLSGLRTRNTYHNGEVSNHVFGIALDIDPHLNTCCHCVAEWAEHPLCSREGTVFDRMSMPECWVQQFRRFGFYWLGDDALEDTMHFEFLGDPNHILVSDGPPPAPPPPEAAPAPTDTAPAAPAATE